MSNNGSAEGFSFFVGLALGWLVTIWVCASLLYTESTVNKVYKAGQCNLPIHASSGSLYYWDEVTKHSYEINSYELGKIIQTKEKK